MDPLPISSPTESQETIEKELGTLLPESKPKSATKKPNDELEKQQSAGPNPTKSLQVYSRRREPISTPEIVQEFEPKIEPSTDSFPFLRIIFQI